MEIGYIKLYRKIDSWEWADDPTMFYFWTRLLLMVNWEDQMYQGELVERGAMITSLSKLASDMKLTVKQVRTCLDRLSKGKQLGIQRARKGTKITLWNYESYQGFEKVKGQGKGTMKGTEKGKETASPCSSPSSLPSPTPLSIVSPNSIPPLVKEEKNSAPLVSPQGENPQQPTFSKKFSDTWEELCKQPKWRKKTSGALNLSLKKLQKFDEEFAIMLMEKAIEYDWQGVVFKDTEAKYQEWLSGKNKKKEFDEAVDLARAKADAERAKKEEEQRRMREEIEKAKADGSFVPTFGKPVRESDEEHRRRVMAQAAAILANKE